MSSRDTRNRRPAISGRTRARPRPGRPRSHGFDWLRDLRAVGGKSARDHGRAMIVDWLEREDRWHALSWRPDVIAERLTNWLMAAEYFYPVDEPLDAKTVPRQPDPPVQTSRSRGRPARSGNRKAEGALRAGADRGVHTGSGAQPPTMARHAERGIGRPDRNRRGPCHPKPDDAAPYPAAPGRAQRGASRRGDRHASADRGRDRPDGPRRCGSCATETAGCACSTTATRKRTG